MWKDEDGHIFGINLFKQLLFYEFKSERVSSQKDILNVSMVLSIDKIYVLEIFCQKKTPETLVFLTDTASEMITKNATYSRFYYFTFLNRCLSLNSTSLF